MSGGYRLNPVYRLQYEAAQQCHVLLYPEGLIRLSETATEILQRLQEPRTLSTLITDICTAFPDAPENTIAEDVNEFVQDALQQGWLDHVD